MPGSEIPQRQLAGEMWKCLGESKQPKDLFIFISHKYAKLGHMYL